jgi:hypothetical protein
MGRERETAPPKALVALSRYRAPSTKSLTLVLALFLLGPACNGSEGPGASIPRSDDLASGGGSGTDVTASPRLSLEEATLQFTDCMRDEGIDMPDIRIGADGRPLLGDVSRRVDIADPSFQDALSTCASILSEAGALDLTSDPELQAVVQDQLQSFSECMRENGIRQFPDPVVGFTGQGSPYPLAELPFDAPQFADAVEICQQRIAFTGLEN